MFGLDTSRCWRTAGAEQPHSTANARPDAARAVLRPRTFFGAIIFIRRAAFCFLTTILWRKKFPRSTAPEIAGLPVASDRDAASQNEALKVMSGFGLRMTHGLGRLSGESRNQRQSAV